MAQCSYILNLGWDLQKIMLANRDYTTHKLCMPCFFCFFLELSVFAKASIIISGFGQAHTVFAIDIKLLKLCKCWEKLFYYFSKWSNFN